MTSPLLDLSARAARPRHCCRQTCTAPAAVSMSYDYSKQVAVVGPLGDETHPTQYELCAVHGELLSVPRGWRIELAVGASVRPRAMDVIDLASWRASASQRV